MSDMLENLWDGLLSRQSERMIESFQQLTVQEQHAVIMHLKRMCSEPGWHVEQQKSAQAALDALENLEID